MSRDNSPKISPKKAPQRSRAAKRNTRRSRSKSKSGTGIDLVGLIDAQFNRRVTATENGKPSRITVFEAIYKQLWTREMGGDARALKVRLKYDAFARKQQPEQKRQIIVEGGLPGHLWKRDALPEIEDDDDV